MLGYTQKLYILPFDHRASFVKDLLGEKTTLTEEEISFLKQEKEIIYEGFKKGISLGIPQKEAAILVDFDFGSEILKDAKVSFITTLMALEKSGEKEFEFDFVDFEDKLRNFSPTFAKVLLLTESFNDSEARKRQIEKLKKINGVCKEQNLKFLIEPLVFNKNDKERTVEQVSFINLINQNGIEPDVWKIEGSEDKDDYQKIVLKARESGRNEVGIVILGGGEDKERVEKIIKAGANTEGIIGFAIGRTIFLPPLLKLKEELITREEAIGKIAQSFYSFYQIFENK